MNSLRSLDAGTMLALFALACMFCFSLCMLAWQVDLWLMRKKMQRNIVKGRRRE